MGYHRPYAKEIMKVFYAVLIQYPSVTDGQTDRQNYYYYYY